MHFSVDDASRRKSHELPTLSRVQGHEAGLPSAQCSARSQAGGTRSEPVLAPRTMGALRHTRAIIRARRLDTFNCHVNLFVPLLIERGCALSRERAIGEKFRVSRADDTQWTIHNDC